MPDAVTKPKPPKAPAAPSRRGLPAVLAVPPDDDNRPAAWLARLAGSVFPMAEELHRKAIAIGNDGDLTATGQRKALAKTVAEAVNKFSGRIAEERKRLDNQRTTLNATIGARVAGDKVSEARQSEWRGVLRGMTREERVQTLRAAAAGTMRAGDEILATVLGAPSPLLCGFAVDDPALAIILDEHKQRLAGPELGELAELDRAEALGQAAVAWLDEYGVELLDGDVGLLRDAQATLQGHRRLSELTVAEKVKRGAEGLAAGLDYRDAYTLRPAKKRSAPPRGR